MRIFRNKCLAILLSVLTIGCLSCFTNSAYAMELPKAEKNKTDKQLVKMKNNKTKI